MFREILQRQQAERVSFRKQLEEAEKLRDAIAIGDRRQASGRHRPPPARLPAGNAPHLTSLTESLAEIKLNGLGTPESHELMERNVLAPLRALQNELIEPANRGPRRADASPRRAARSGQSASRRRGAAGPNH